MLEDYKKIGLPIQLKHFKIQTISATIDVGFEINILALDRDRDIGKFCFYDPEQSPALKVDILELNTTANIYSTGTIVWLVAKSRNHIYKSYLYLFPYILRYKLETELRQNRLENGRKMKPLLPPSYQYAITYNYQQHKNAPLNKINNYIEEQTKLHITQDELNKVNKSNKNTSSSNESNNDHIYTTITGLKRKYNN